ncbi:Uncharacterised protein [Mycobacterium tuberculosis]|uniref:Uncharacterized protein n=1 Tax=Mycobacterium tuberculosis TaxID=1773 RepID=A0A0U0R726_MYCTX|nr:Uncharacterised protein [Mycobacterium tuberculosis]
MSNALRTANSGSARTAIQPAAYAQSVAVRVTELRGSLGSFKPLRPAITGRPFQESPSDRWLRVKSRPCATAARR